MKQSHGQALANPAVEDMLNPLGFVYHLALSLRLVAKACGFSSEGLGQRKDKLLAMASKLPEMASSY